MGKLTIMPSSVVPYLSSVHPQPVRGTQSLGSCMKRRLQPWRRLHPPPGRCAYGGLIIQHAAKQSIHHLYGLPKRCRIESAFRGCFDSDWPAHPPIESASFPTAPLICPGTAGGLSSQHNIATTVKQAFRLRRSSYNSRAKALGAYCELGIRARARRTDRGTYRSIPNSLAGDR